MTSRGWAAAAALVATMASAGAAPAPAPGQGPAPRPGPETMRRAYDRAARFGSAEMGRLVYRASVEPNWIQGTARFWYRVDVRGKRWFVLVDAERGTRGPAFDHARLAGALSAAAGQRFEPHRLPFTAIAPSADGATVVFRVGTRWWRCDLTTYRLEPVEAPLAAPAQPAAPPRAPARDPARSPNGAWTVFVRDHNLWLRSASGEETRVTSDGIEANAYAPASWSPDSRTLLAARTQPGARLPMFNVESAPAGELRPRLRQAPYDLPGDRIDVHTLWLVDAATRRITPVRSESIDYGAPPAPRWSPDGARFTFEQIFRGYGRDRIAEVDVETGAVRDIVDERSSTFVYPPVRFVRWLDATGELLWTSQRDGWCHLYLIDARTGTVKRQVTRGPWVVRGVERVDEQARQVIVAASGREAGRDPYLIHYYRVGLDGGEPVLLTPGNGQHTIRFSPDGRFFLNTWSRVDHAPVTELRRADDGSLVVTLERADVADLLATGWRWPEPFRAKGRDGRTDIWGVIYRPSTFDPRRRYPVIEDIYAGPQGSFVPKTFAAQRAPQALAELGFIVVQIDGMGTANRSKAFHAVAHRNLGDGGFPDRIAWMRAAARRYPYLDLERVGIYGYSAGGYNAARALLAFGSFYRVAAAMAGNHDHRTDKLWWNELWMGWPVGPHYAQQSNVTQARRLRGRLLLVHGELDDNVNPHASTMQFVNALIAANRDFDMLLVPGAGHGLGAYVRKRVWDHFVRHLLGAEPPLHYALPSGVDGSIFVTVRNLTDRPVTLYWLPGDGRRVRYSEVAPGGTHRQHTFDGHEWEAVSDGRTVGWYTGAAAAPEWDIVPAR
ncbi:MAG TPA: prolyl oligopeptidase family serine peptidase [Chthonomonadales bacterium]|nr:prolyl oligopeptidase family serine peptidase [Chthonomonadales bacterium]